MLLKSLHYTFHSMIEDFSASCNTLRGIKLAASQANRLCSACLLPITVCRQFQQYCETYNSDKSAIIFMYYMYFIKFYSKTKINEQPCLVWHSQLNQSYHQRKLGHLMLYSLLIILKTNKKKMLENYCIKFKMLFVS